MGIEKLEEILKQVPDERRQFLRTKYRLTSRISQIIKQKKLTQEEVAKRAGLRASFMSRLISPNHNPTLKTIAKIETALGEHLIEVSKEAPQGEWVPADEPKLPSLSGHMIWKETLYPRIAESRRWEDISDELYYALDVDRASSSEYNLESKKVLNFKMAIAQIDPTIAFQRGDA